MATPNDSSPERWNVLVLLILLPLAMGLLIAQTFQSAWVAAEKAEAEVAELELLGKREIRQRAARRSAATRQATIAEECPDACQSMSLASTAEGAAHGQ